MGVQSETVYYVTCDGCEVQAAYGKSAQIAEDLARQRGMVRFHVKSDVYRWYCSLCAYTRHHVSVRAHDRCA